MAARPVSTATPALDVSNLSWIFQPKDGFCAFQELTCANRGYLSGQSDVSLTATYGGPSWIRLYEQLKQKQAVPLRCPLFDLGGAKLFCVVRPELFFLASAQDQLRTRHEKGTVNVARMPQRIEALKTWLRASEKSAENLMITDFCEMIFARVFPE